MGQLLEARLVTAAISTILILLVIPVAGYLILLARKGLLYLLEMIFDGKTIWLIANRLTFPGVIHHECAHALFVVLTGAKIQDVELFHPQNDRLGSVTWYAKSVFPGAQSIQCTLVSVAPVILGILDFCLLYAFLLPRCTQVWQTILVVYLMLSIFFHATMSSQDIRIAWKGLPVCALILLVVFFVTGFDAAAVLQHTIFS
ncbi:MAG: hypothetical protein ACI3XW_06090 [Butyricicoccus sp.]